MSANVSTLERFGRLFEATCLIGCGAALGVSLTAVRVRGVVSRRYEAELSACREDLSSHDAFIRLVVADVEKSVERAGAVLRSGVGLSHACTPTDPPTALAGGQWWVFADGKWAPVSWAPVSWGEVAP